MYWQDFVLAKVNSQGGIVDCDSRHEHVRLRSEAILTQEINFAMHLSVHAIVIDMPQTARIENFARILTSYTSNVHTSSTRFLLRIEIPGNFDDAEEVYQKFLEFKQLTGHTCQSIQLILVIGDDLPSWEHFNHRWIGEKVHSVQVHSSSFINNAKGFPVMSKKHQECIRAFMRQQVRVIVRSRHPNDSLESHYQYLCHLFKTHDQLDEDDRIEVSYRNYLQSPLQPLADNLEAATYEVFENDKIKYDIYEEGLYKAFLDKKKHGRFL